jgi:uncharacterized protein YndB with AHSA1/START domain
MAARNVADAKPAANELLITRVFNAPRELVWKAWTDPRQARQWWGPRDYPAVHTEMDVRPGGRWRSCLRSTETGQELWNGGVFREVAPPERLVFTFAWEAEGERGLETVVTVILVEQKGKTLMTLSFWLVAAARWCRIRRAIQQVAQLDDRMLKDIGIHRSEIERAVRWGRAR